MLSFPILAQFKGFPCPKILNNYFVPWKMIMEINFSGWKLAGIGIKKFSCPALHRPYHV